MRHSVHLFGPAGAGKTALAARLARELGLPLISLGRVYRALAVVGDAGGHLDDIAIERTAAGGLVAVHRGEVVERELYAVRSVAAGLDRVGGRERARTLVEKVLDGIEDDVVVEGRPSPSILRRCGHPVLLTAHPAERRRRLGREPDYSAEAARSAGGEDTANRGLFAAVDATDPRLTVVDSTARSEDEVVTALQRAVGGGYDGDDLRVVVPARQRSSVAAVMLRSLAEALDRVGGRADVVMVDDAGPEPLESPAPAAVRMIRNAEPLGAAAARNRGLDASDGAITVFLDSDVVLEPDHFRWLLDTHTRSPFCVVVGPRSHVPAQDWGRGPVAAPPDSRERAMARVGTPLHRLRRPWLLAYTCNVSFPTALAPRLRFWADLRGWGLEDVEFFYRLHTAAAPGWIFDPALRVQHRCAGEVDVESRWRGWSANRALVERRHGAPLAEPLAVLAGVFDPARRGDYLDAMVALEEGRSMDALDTRAGQLLADRWPGSPS